MMAPSLNADVSSEVSPGQHSGVAPIIAKTLPNASRANVATAEKRAALVSLLVQDAHGNENALKAVYDATSNRLFGVCLRICINHECAAEALQDTYLVVWRRRKL